jgi:hypothetical protein
MTPITIYTTKAALYARYRWRYAAQAIDTIFERTGLDQTSIGIELGAGTGILSREICPHLKHLFAVEPDLQMSTWIKEGLPAGSPISILSAQAEAVPLPTGCANAVIAAQAIHWFHPTTARSEIRRLLNDKGWLILVRNSGIDPNLNQAFQELNSPENGIQPHSRLATFDPQPVEYYYGHSAHECFRFAFAEAQDWESFLGSLCSASFVPDETHPAFPRFKQQARRVFDKFAVNGWLTSQIETELLLGQVSR